MRKSARTTVKVAIIFHDEPVMDMISAVLQEDGFSTSSIFIGNILSPKDYIQEKLKEDKPNVIIFGTGRQLNESLKLYSQIKSIPEVEDCGFAIASHSKLHGIQSDEVIKLPTASIEIFTQSVERAYYKAERIRLEKEERLRKEREI